MKPPRWTAKQISVLRVIAEADRPLCGSDIAEILNINRGHVYPILKRMHGYGILMRHRKTVTSTRYVYGVTRFGAAYTRAVLEGAGRPELCKLFDGLLEESSLDAPHVKTASGSIPIQVRQRMHQAVVNKQGEL